MTIESETGDDDPPEENHDAPSDDEATDERDSSSIVPEPRSTPVLSGQIEPEHAALVALGALATVVVFLQLSGVAF